MPLTQKEIKRMERLAESPLPKSTNKNKNLFALGIGGIDQVLASLRGLTIEKTEILHESESYQTDPPLVERIVKLTFTDGSQLMFDTSAGGDEV